MVINGVTIPWRRNASPVHLSSARLFGGIGVACELHLKMKKFSKPKKNLEPKKFYRNIAIEYGSDKIIRVQCKG